MAEDKRKLAELNAAEKEERKRKWVAAAPALGPACRRRWPPPPLRLPPTPPAHTHTHTPNTHTPNTPLARREEALAALQQAVAAANGPGGSEGGAPGQEGAAAAAGAPAGAGAAAAKRLKAAKEALAALDESDDEEEPAWELPAELQVRGVWSGVQRCGALGGCWRGGAKALLHNPGAQGYHFQPTPPRPHTAHTPHCTHTPCRRSMPATRATARPWRASGRGSRRRGRSWRKRRRGGWLARWWGWGWGWACEWSLAAVLGLGLVAGGLPVAGCWRACWACWSLAGVPGLGLSRARSHARSTWALAAAPAAAAAHTRPLPHPPPPSGGTPARRGAPRSARRGGAPRRRPPRLATRSGAPQRSRWLRRRRRWSGSWSGWRRAGARGGWVVVGGWGGEGVGPEGRGGVEGCGAGYGRTGWSCAAGAASCSRSACLKLPWPTRPPCTHPPTPPAPPAQGASGPGPPLPPLLVGRGGAAGRRAGGGGGRVLARAGQHRRGRRSDGVAGQPRAARAGARLGGCFWGGGCLGLWLGPAACWRAVPQQALPRPPAPALNRLLARRSCAARWRRATAPSPPPSARQPPRATRPRVRPARPPACLCCCCCCRRRRALQLPPPCHERRALPAPGTPAAAPPHRTAPPLLQPAPRRRASARPPSGRCPAGAPRSAPRPRRRRRLLQLPPPRPAGPAAPPSARAPARWRRCRSWRCRAPPRRWTAWPLPLRPPRCMRRLAAGRAGAPRWLHWWRARAAWTSAGSRRCRWAAGEGREAGEGGADARRPPGRRRARSCQPPRS
jgi:hypothetical protein